MQEIKEKLILGIEQGLISVIDGYNYNLAIDQAINIIKTPAKEGYKPMSESCTVESIETSLTKMLNDGLYPAYSQCSFKPYKNVCTYSVDNKGKHILAKRSGMINIESFTLFEGMEAGLTFDQKTGNVILKSFDFAPNYGTKQSNVIGAYAIAFFNGFSKTEYMTKDQIKISWSKGYGYKDNSGIHAEFPDMMARKTVENRLLTNIYKTSGGASSDIEIENITDSDYIGETKEIVIAAPIKQPTHVKQPEPIEQPEPVKQSEPVKPDDNELPF